MHDQKSAAGRPRNVRGSARAHAHFSYLVCVCVCVRVCAVLLRYSQGLGDLPRDPAKAMQLLEHSCDKRHAKSCTRAAEVRPLRSVAVKKKATDRAHQHYAAGMHALQGMGARAARKHGPVRAQRANMARSRARVIISAPL